MIAEIGISVYPWIAGFGEMYWKLAFYWTLAIDSLFEAFRYSFIDFFKFGKSQLIFSNLGFLWLKLLAAFNSTILIDYNVAFTVVHKAFDFHWQALLQ